MELFALLFSSAFVANVILSRFLGICPFLGVSKRRGAALGMGGAVIFVVVTASVICYGIQYLVLAPAGVEYLQTLVFILVIASLVQFIEFFMKKYLVSLYKALGIYLPLITTNCVVLGVAKNVAAGGDASMNFVDALVYSLGTAVGYAVVIYIFSAIRERLERVDVPRPFRGTSIALITAAIMALAFSGLAGMF